jgi:hypothetical protein
MLDSVEDVIASVFCEATPALARYRAQRGASVSAPISEFCQQW